MGSHYKRNYLLLLAITIAVLTVSGYLYIKYEADRIRKDKYEFLSSIAKLKVEELSSRIQNEFEDALQISKDLFLLSKVENLLLKREDTKNQLLKYLNRIKAEQGYQDILVFSNNGELISSIIKPRDSKVSSVLLKCVNQAASAKKVVFSDLYWSEDHKVTRLDFVAPIINENGVVAASIAFRVNPYTTVFPLIQRWPTKSRSAENLLVRRDGDSVLFLNDIKFYKDASLKLRIPISKTEVPAVKAVLGNLGFYDGVDYRGVKVLAYISPVPNTNWFMVTKVDKDEVFNELNYRTALNVTIILLLIFFTVLGFAVLHYYRSRKHLKDLLVKEQAVTSAQEVFRTTLYSIGDGVITTDRFANVKQMNAVAENLTGWKEEDALGKPIQKVFNIINEDTRKKVENPVERVLSEGVIVGLANHTLLISKDGKEIPIADSGAPIKYQDGNIEGVVLVFRDQSEERNVQRKLTKSERKYRSIFENDNMIMLLINPKTGVIVDANEGAELFYGWSREQLMQMNINQINTLSQEEIIRRMRDVQHTQVKRFEFKHRKADSTIADVEVIRGDIQIGDEELFYVIVHDITEKKKIETEKFRMASLVENSLNEIYIFGSNTLKFEYANPAALSNMGYSLEEIKNFTPSDIKPLINEEELRNLIQPLKTGEIQKLVFETTHRRKNGTDYFVEVHLQIYHDTDRNVFFSLINDITERKFNEQALRESEEQFRNIFEVASIGIAHILTQEGRIIACNDKYCELTGYTREELKSIPYRQLTFEGDRDTDMQKFLAAFRGETKHYLNEKRYVRKDGSLIWVRVNMAFIRDESGAPVRTVKVVEDISQAKELEKELYKREQNLAVTLQSIGDGVITTDTNGLVTNMNYVAEKLTGCTLLESKGKQLTQVFNIVNARDREKVENPVEKVIAEGEIVGLANHTILISKDGTEYQIADSAATIKDNTGNIIGVVLVFRDQTEEYIAQQKLEQNEKKFRLIFETSPDSITISRVEDGLLLDFNLGFCQLSGYDREEAIGKTSTELDIWYNENQRDEILNRIKSNKPIDNYEVNFRKKNGEIIICYVSSRVLNIFGEICVLTLTRDVTEKIIHSKEIERYKNQLEEMIEERTSELNLANKNLTEEILKGKEVEAKLEESYLREKELNILKSRFISTTSHEFRTPLTTVLSSAELIQRGLGKITDEKILSYTSRIKNSVSYLTHLLDDILTLNRADAGKLKYEPKKIDLKVLCEESLETALFYSNDMHKVHFDFHPHNTHFYLDEKLTHFVVSNVLVNAFKYSPDGGLVSFVVKENNNDIVISIADEGIGISDEDKVLMFEPFHRSSNSVHIPGSGLGLSIVQKSVELLNGKITFESEINRGTTFTITIPKN